MDEAFAVALGEIRAVLEHVAAFRIREAAHVLAFEIGPHAVHQHFCLRVLDHEVATGAVVAHRAQVGHRRALRVGERHRAGRDEAVIAIQYAVGHAHYAFQLGLTIGDHRVARFERAPQADRQNSHAHYR